MKYVRVAAAVLNQTPLDWSGNQARIAEAIERARAARAQVLCLPELCITGYGCEDTFHSSGLQATACEVLCEILPLTSGMIVCLGLPLLYRNGVFDCACLAVDGRIAGFVAKRFLSGDGLHYEPRWFKAWPRGERDRIQVAGESYPIGDLVFDCEGIRIGFEICEDAWVAARPGGGMASYGVDIILNPSASHFAFGKFEVRKRLVLEGSRALNASYVYANLLGNEAGRIIYDGGALIASAGRLLAQGSRLSYAPVEVVAASVDVAATRLRSSQLASYQPNLTASRSAEVACPFQWPDLSPEPVRLRAADWELSPSIKEEEFTRAVGLGLFDYLRKSRAHGFVVSLSGGADSSATACLVAMMVRMACAELGPEWFNEALSYIGRLRETTSCGERVRHLLHCVYQASENSGRTTHDAAAAVAAAIGAEFSGTEIGAAVRGYVETIEAMIGRKLAWETDDLALQNIQARARGPGVWLLANLKQALLLSTSNRSEAAVGYATMDGDTCGGLAPIAGVDKAFLRRWLVWLETEGPAGLGAIPELRAVNQLQPTAELRPPGAGQTDEDDLMPYPVLDAVERAAIRDKQSPREVFRQIRSEFPEYSPKQLCDFVERFFRLWCRNQWKRERYAPSFHLDDENLDPKTWCRFPILSGGFQRELEQLRDDVRTLEESS